MPKENLEKELQEAILKDYGVNVTIEESEEILSGLVEFFSTLGKIYARMPKENNYGTMSKPD